MISPGIFRARTASGRVKEKNMRELWLDKKKRYLILLSCLAFLLAAHAYRWMNAMYNHDSLLILQEDADWQISLGRIFNPLYVWLRGRVVAPMNVALFSGAFLILSSALVIRTLGLKDKASFIICCGFLTTFETLVFVNGSFILSLDLDMLALLFSVLAAYFFTGPKSVPRFAAGVLSVTAMLGLFQSYAEVTILLVCLVLLREALEGGDPKKIFVKALRSAGLMVLGGILYFICLKTALRVTGIDPASTNNGLVKMKYLTVRRAVSLAKDAWMYTMRYLFSDSMISHRFISRWVYRALGFFSLMSIAWIAVRKHLKIWSLALIAFLLLFMPLGGNMVYVLSLGFKHSLMNYSFVFFSVLAVLVFDLLCPDIRPGRYARRAILALCAVLLLNHILFANQWYIRNDLYSRAGMSFMTRLVSDMEDTEGYKVGSTPVLILGVIDQNPASYLNRNMEIVSDIMVGTTHHLAVSYYRTYEWFFHNVLGYNAKVIPVEEVAGYIDDPQIQAMPIYPAPGSVQMVNGVLVVRLSEDLRPEELTW